MNGQQRAKENIDRIYLEKVETLENYRGYKKILFIRPYSNVYLGYLDNQFFGYKVRKDDGIQYWIMDIKKAVDYYIDKVFFKNPVLEYDTFLRIKEYGPSVKLLDMVREGKSQ